MRSPVNAAASALIPNSFNAGAMFHNMGLTPQYASANKRFEVDGANTARDFLRSHGIAETDIEGPENFCRMIHAFAWPG